MESDCVLGHEAAGIVLKVGEGVKDLVVGEFIFCFTFFLSFLSFSLSLRLLGEDVSCVKRYACVRRKSGESNEQRCRRSRQEQGRKEVGG